MYIFRKVFPGMYNTKPSINSTKESQTVFTLQRSMIKTFNNIKNQINNIK